MLPFAPRIDAAHGGGRLIAQFLCEITEMNQAAIVYLRSRDEPELGDFFRERCALTVEVPRPIAGTRFSQRLIRYGQVLRASVQQRPVWVADWTSKAYYRRVQEISRQFQPDIVQAEYQVMGQYLSAFNGGHTPRVLVAHEPGARTAPYLRNLPAFAGSVIHRMEKRAWRRYETAVFRQVDAVVSFSDPDRQAILRTAGKTPVHIIRPGFALPERPLNPLGVLPHGLLFVGNFVHPPNVAAAVRLLRAIWPVVHQTRPDVTLTIVGDQPPPELRKLAGENVIVTGRVPDTTPYLDRTAVFTAPIYSGGGVRIKVLEALAAGKAVVATPLAAEGLDLAHGEQICLAGNDAETAVYIIDLLNNPQKREALATRARTWACAHLGWAESISRYEALYAQLLEQSRQDNRLLH